MKTETLVDVKCWATQIFTEIRRRLSGYMLKRSMVNRVEKANFLDAQSTKIGCVA